MALTPAQQRAKIQAKAESIAAQVIRRANAGVQTAAIFLAARTKETVSVPAPRKRVVSKLGDIRYRATSRAIPGAPPRKLSGRLRHSITHAYMPSNNPNEKRGYGGKGIVGVKARSPKGFNYPKHLEKTNHKFLIVTAMRWRRQLEAIVGRRVRFVR